MRVERSDIVVEDCCDAGSGGGGGGGTIPKRVRVGVGVGGGGVWGRAERGSAMTLPRPPPPLHLPPPTPFPLYPLNETSGEATSHREPCLTIVRKGWTRGGTRREGRGTAGGTAPTPWNRPMLKPAGSPGREHHQAREGSLTWAFDTISSVGLDCACGWRPASSCSPSSSGSESTRCRRDRAGLGVVLIGLGLGLEYAPPPSWGRGCHVEHHG